MNRYLVLLSCCLREVTLNPYFDDVEDNKGWNVMKNSWYCSTCNESDRYLIRVRINHE